MGFINSIYKYICKLFIYSIYIEYIFKQLPDRAMEAKTLCNIKEIKQLPLLTNTYFFPNDNSSMSLILLPLR